MVRDAFRPGKTIDGLDKLRREQRVLFDHDVLRKVEKGEWLLVKDEAYVFDWAHFEQPFRQKLREQGARELMRVKAEEGTTFCALDSEIMEPLTYRNFKVTENSQTHWALTDYKGVAHIAAMSISGIKLTD